jgi:hypothetical protein
VKVDADIALMAMIKKQIPSEDDKHRIYQNVLIGTILDANINTESPLKPMLWGFYFQYFQKKIVKKRKTKK